MREAPTAAAATEAQTAAQIAADIAPRTKDNLNTHTCETVGDSPTPNAMSEDTHWPRQSEYEREAPEIQEARAVTTPRPGFDSRLEYG
jgi:hypothetical protein